MTKLSVNINKVATIRNARGANTPDVAKFAVDCQALGADGITVHPRPDERHIRKSDVFAIKSQIKVEFNIEGYPSEDFLQLVCSIKPAQVTLVPDSPDQLTSYHGWDTKTHLEELDQIISRLKASGIRTSVFVDPSEEMVQYAAQAGADRIELYTEPYASLFLADAEAAIAPFVTAAKKAKELGLGLNAGHDLNLQNLSFFIQRIPWVDEVSIGHYLISDALYLGIAETIRQYKNCLVSSEKSV